MTENGEEAGKRHNNRRIPGIFSREIEMVDIIKQSYNNHGKGPLAAIQNKRSKRQQFISGAQHIRGADIAGADLADVAIARQFCQHKAERDRTDKISH